MHSSWQQHSATAHVIAGYYCTYIVRYVRRRALSA